MHWKEWCWSSSILVNWCEQMTHWQSLWCWERLRKDEEGVRWWDGWTASSMQWTWTWANSGRWWRTGRPGVLQSMGSQRGGDDWVTEQQQQHLHWSSAPAHPTHPQYLRMWLYLEIGSLKMQLVMMKSWGTSIQDDWCPYKKEKLGYRDIHTHRKSYEHDGRDQGDPSAGQRTPQIASNHQNLGKAWNSFSITDFEGANLTDPWFQTSSLQNWETIHFCCLRHNSWYFVRAALGN